MDLEDINGLNIACKTGEDRTVLEICTRSPHAVFHSRKEWVRGWLVTGLHLASAAGHVECCRVLLDFGADVEAKDAYKRTPLMYAATLEVVQVLLSHKANVHARDSSGMTPLHLCAFVGQDQDKRCVGELVFAGASVNALDVSGRTPLMALMEQVGLYAPELNVGLELVRRGADANTADTFFRWTLLHHCAAHRAGRSSALPGSDVNGLLEGQRSQIIGELIELGADVDARTKKGSTALHVAVKNGQKEVLCQLIKLGANINATDDYGNSALSFAILNKRTELFNHLISAGADANTCNVDDEIALQFVAKRGYSHCAKELAKAGAQMETSDRDGNTPLLLAVKNGHIETVCALVDAGAAVDACNRHGETAVHLAAKNGLTEMVAQLVTCRAPFDTLDSMGCTPLILALKGGFSGTAHELRKAGANLESTDESGNTLLHLAVTHQGETVSDLISAGVNVQALNNAGESALLLAVNGEFTSAVNELLKADASVNVLDNGGNSLLSVASKSGNGELCCSLVHYGAKVDDTISFYKCCCNAVKADSTSMLAQLLDIGASINECNEVGGNVLFFALDHLQLRMAEWIIEHGGNVFQANVSGWTPLHLAAQLHTVSLQRRLDIVKLLLAKGADPTALTDGAETPLAIARKRGNYVVMTTLERAELAHQLIKAGGEARSPTAVAIRFGGPPGAGKSTLAQALQVTRFGSYFRYERQTDEGAANMQQRTKGINCQTFVDEDSARFTIFDLGGHGEFLATHQMFIGDGSVPVIDCVVVSALDDKLKDMALKWCSLFASRNEPVAVPWPLLLIATRADTATEQQKHAVVSAYHDVRQTFSEYFHFPCSEPIFIDARKSWDGPTIELRQVLNRLHRKLIGHDDSQVQPAICRSIEENLVALRRTTSSPVILKERFIEFMLPRVALPETVTEEIEALFDKALKYLSGYAAVLSFNQPLVQRHVVINPHWLLSDIVGRLMAEPPLPRPYVHYENGYAKTSDVVAALATKHLPGREALEMVAGLGFCLEQKSAGTVLNPSKLRGYQRDEHWRQDANMTVYAGRRLKCKGTVAIASAFFSHLQVHFYHRYLSDFNEKLPMWAGGIRLVAGQRSSAEALIEADPSNLSVDIIVRGREDSERECSNLLHSLTEETLKKAAEISPGSQLRLFFLSKLELAKFLASDSPSRLLVEYSEERVLRAIGRGEHVTDGKASSPENPDDLLLPAYFKQQSVLLDELKSEPAKPLTQSLSVQDWRVVLLRVAEVINSFDECESLAEGLQLNVRGEDIVKKLLEVDPRRLSSDVAFSLFVRWLQRGASELSTEQRRKKLIGVFRANLQRPVLCDVLHDELRAVCGGDDLQDN